MTAWLEVIEFWLELGYRAWVPGPAGEEITPALIEAELAGSQKIRRLLATCEENMLLSRREPEPFGVPLPANICVNRGPRPET